MPDMIVDVDTAVTVPVNLMPLIDDTDFKTIEDAIAYNATGMDLRWNFQTTAGVTTSTAVTPTTAGDYDWTHNGDGIYEIEIPASGGASINNDTEGFGWFSGVITGVLPFRGPVIQFSPATLVASLVDDAPENLLFVQFAGAPKLIRNPLSSTDTYKIRFTTSDHNNTLVAPDSAPTVTLVDQDGTDLSSRLDTTTPTALSTGLYEVTYTATAGQAGASLRIGATATKSGYSTQPGYATIDLESLVNANIEQINTVTITGDGSPGTEFGV